VSKPWIPEQELRLRELVSAGLTGGQIAAKLGGISRNSVVGKVMRLGLRLSGGSNASTRSIEPRQIGAPRHRAHKPTRAEICRLATDQREPRHLSLIDLEPTDCKYPFGEGPFTFCGHPQIEGAPYCAAHLILCTGAPRS
jgi:GcrA cell cycle regulator